MTDVTRIARPWAETTRPSTSRATSRWSVNARNRPVACIIATPDAMRSRSDVNVLVATVSPASHREGIHAHRRTECLHDVISTVGWPEITHLEWSLPGLMDADGTSSRGGRTSVRMSDISCTKSVLRGRSAHVSNQTGTRLGPCIVASPPVVSCQGLIFVPGTDTGSCGRGRVRFSRWPPPRAVTGRSTPAAVTTVKSTASAPEPESKHFTSRHNTRAAQVPTNGGNRVPLAS